MNFLSSIVYLTVDKFWRKASKIFNFTSDYFKNNKTPAKALTSPAKEKQCTTLFIDAGLS